MSPDGPRDQPPFDDEFDATREFDFGEQVRSGRDRDASRGKTGKRGKRQPGRGPASRGGGGRQARTGGGLGDDGYGGSRASGYGSGRGYDDPTPTRPGAGFDDGLPHRPGRQPRGYDDPLPGRPSRPLPPKQRRPAWQRIGIGLGVFIVIVLIAAGGVRAAYSGKALPGTQVGGESVGGQTEAELRDTVRRLANPERRVNLIGPEKTLQVTAAGGGLNADIDATVDAAMASRRGNFLSPLRALVDGANIPLQADVDDDKLRASVARIAGEVDRKPYAGALTIDPETLAVQTKASKAGREVNRDDLADLLRAALLRPGSGAVDVPVESTKAVSEKGVEGVASDAEQYLRAPLEMTGAGSPYEVKPSDLAGLLALEPVDDGRDARLGVDSAALSKLTAKVAAARDQSAKSASISAPARGPVLDGKAEVSWSPKKADVTVNSEGRTGLAVVVKDLNAKVRAAVRKGEHTLTVPVKKTEPPVSRTSAKKIDRVIGTFSTPYVAGQPRVTNIQRIAKSIDRTIIAPGQQFSMNGIAGERTLAKGYVEAPFIAGNKIEPSVGGGVSQFSTTMYNAAYFAGLQIDAHQPHSLYIDRYPPGRESTLNFPDIDMKWTNDTDVPILIRTYADDAGVTVTLYGDNGGRKVTAEPGSREPNPGGDFSITVTRKITYPGGRVVTQPSTTKYANEVVEEAPQE